MANTHEDDMTPEPLEPETLEAKIAALRQTVRSTYSNYIADFSAADLIIDQILAERDAAIKGECAADQEVQRLQAEREKDNAEIAGLRLVRETVEKEIQELIADYKRQIDLFKAGDAWTEQDYKALQAQLAAKDKLLAMALNFINNKAGHGIHCDWYDTSPYNNKTCNCGLDAVKVALSQQDTRPPLPEGFAYATSTELFQALGKPKDEAESMERGLNAVVRREEIRANNTQQDTGTTALEGEV